MTVEAPSQSKFQRFRERQKARGFRELRMWVYDVRSPAFLEQIAREGALLRGRPEEEDAIAFAEAIHAELPDEPE